MKKIIYSFTLLFAVLFGCNCIASAQIQLNVTKNDSVIIELGGYKQGTISWQRSTTGQTFTTMSAYKDKKELRYKASGPLFFRTKIDDNTCEPVYSDTLQVNITSLFNVKGGQGYIESAPFVAAEGGLTMRENGVLSNWSNSQRKPVWFLYQTPGTYEVSFNIRGSNGLNYQFEMKTSSPGVKAYEPEVFPFEYAGIGSSELRKFFTITIPAAGYYRYELNAISSNMNGLTIEDLKFTGIQEPGKAEPKTYAESRLFSTSLHMGFSSSANTTKEYDWLYEE
ncbi:MAG: hypothetical protein LBH12_02895, partial [Dysgonamonadaceae bacterium]|nr:hypothetical protein [Dysgonamonadaceae bacterium]